MSTTPAHVIVVGNEKGGSGKSTIAMHLIVGLLQSGYSVASIDVDFRQGSLSRYLANRRSFIKAAGSDVTMPSPYTINPPVTLIPPGQTVSIILKIIRVTPKA